MTHMNCFHLSIHLQLAASLKQLWGRAPCGVGFPGGSAVKNLPARQEMWVQFLGWQDPLEKERQPTPVFLPGKSMDRGTWQVTVHGVPKSQARSSHETTARVPRCAPSPHADPRISSSPSCSSPAFLSCAARGAPEKSAVLPHTQVTLGDAVLARIILLMLSVVWWWASTLCTKPVTSSLSSIYSVMFIKCLHCLSGTLPTLRMQQ